MAVAGLDVELTESVTDSFSLFSFFLPISTHTQSFSLSYFFSFWFFSSLTKGLPSFKGGVMTQGSGVKILSFSLSCLTAYLPSENQLRQVCCSFSLFFFVKSE